MPRNNSDTVSDAKTFVLIQHDCWLLKQCCLSLVLKVYNITCIGHYYNKMYYALSL